MAAINGGESRNPAWDLLDRAEEGPDCGTAGSLDNSTMVARREIRQLSRGEVAELVRAVAGLAADQAVAEAPTIIPASPKCDPATSLRRLMAPYYWDWRLELELGEPAHSSIFELLTLSASTASKLSSSAALANFTASTLASVSANRSHEALELADRDPTGVLALLLALQTDDNGEMPTLGKAGCSASDPHWLYWDHVDAKCRAVAMSAASPLVQNTTAEAPSSTTTAMSIHHSPTPRRKRPKSPGEKRKKGGRRRLFDANLTNTSSTVAFKKHGKGKAKQWLQPATASPPSAENSLDSLLPLLMRHKVPKGTIAWRGSTPFPVVYFTITLVEGGGGGGGDATSFFPGPASGNGGGGSHRRRSIAPRLKYRQDHSRGRVKGARVYLMGLNMPTGYMQITQGKQIRGTNSAVVRALSPHSAGPFVEFKLRVENRYGTACKQMCLEAGGGGGRRYRRCMRRLVRLSTYKRFSDPIPFHRSEQEALDAQWTGKGYYRQRKLDHLLFKCD